MKVSLKGLISSRLFKYLPNKFVCFSQVGIKMAPVDNSLSSPLNTQFQLISSLKANNLIPVHKYKSKLTNLQVVIAEVEGPLVDGHFCLATEAYDDDGLPHTLEHLIFLGSEDYPYKGVLDLLANRCLASGTNAWTDTDHTCYTVRTAGSDGFLTLLPIYLDHILYPTLTDSGYITEVHHINEEGNDAGVVYSEMQGVENTGESLCHLMMIRSIYPGKCGYKSETGGLLKNLRESTNNEKVRNFHKEFYRSDNLTLIITGQVKPEHVFAALQPFEEKILAKGNRGDFIRPWQSPVPPFTESINTEVLYPCDEEDNGMVYIGWRGPSSVTELYQMSACSILLKYLTDNSVSPLQKEFVETEDPHCSKVSYSLIENSETILYLMFENVPTGKLCEIKDRLDIVLNRITSGAEPLDIKRMRTVLHRHKLEALIHLENSPHETITYMVIGDMLYGNTSTDLNQRLNLVEDLRKMEIESQDFWVGLLKKYLVDGPSVTIRGRPSKDGEKKMVQDELARIEAQRQKLGEAGLSKCAEDLSKATRHNETPPPDEMLTCVPIPSMESINFYPIGSFTTYSEKQHPKFNLKNVPVQMHLDDVHSNFIYLYVLLDTSKIDPALRPYLPLLLESLLELPVQRGESLIPYEEIVAELENDTITAETRLGLDSSARFSCGPYAQTACLGLQLEPSKYERCVEWIRELLYQTRFTVERIRVVAAKIANDVAQAKRQGYKVVWDLMKGILYNKESNFYVTSMLRQHRLLTAVLSQLDKPDTAGKVLSDLESLRRSITVPGNICIHMAADLNKLTEHSAEPALIWKKILTPAHEPLQQTLHVVPDWNFRQPEVEILPSCLVGLGCLESSFLCQTCTSMKDFNHPDLPALLVFLQYLTQLEGPMWRQIRGLGLAYGFTMCPKPNEGILFLTLYRAANCVAAYKEARNIVETQMNEDARWEQTLFDSAKSSIIFEIIEREKSVGDVVNHSLLSYFKGVSHDYNRELVRRVSATTVEDVKRVGPLYVKPLFNSKIAKTTIVTNPAKSDEIAKGFSEFGINLEVLPSLENCFLSEW